MRDARWCAQDSTRKPTWFFTSFFFEKMFENNGYSYASVKRWSKKVKCTNGNVFLLDKMVVPVNVSNTHWCCCVAFVQKKQIKYFDSMGGDGMKYMEGLKVRTLRGVVDRQQQRAGWT
jgi:Ulp1 family protease